MAEQRANPSQVFNDFVDSLPDDQVLQLDQAMSDLLPLTTQPDFIRHDRAAREGYVQKYLQTQIPELESIFQGFTGRGPVGQHIIDQVLGAPTFQQTTGRAIYNTGKAVAGIAGATAGAALTGGNPVGAGILGAAAYTGAEMLLRNIFTDLPEPSFIEQAVDSAIEGGTQGLGQLGFNAVSALGERVVGGPVRSTLLGSNFALKPEEARTFQILDEGSTLLGRAGTPSEGTMTTGQIMTNRGTPTGGTFIEEMMRNSFGGGIFSRHQYTRARQAVEAFLGRYTNTIDALNDPRDAANAVVQGYRTRQTVAAQARRDVYEAAGQLSTSVPGQDTTGLLDLFTQGAARPDIARIQQVMARDIPTGVADDIQGLLSTTHSGPLSTLPASAIKPGMSITVQGNPGIYVGPGTAPQTVTVSFPGLPSGQGGIQVASNAVEASVTVPEASYANLRLFSSLMKGMQRAGEEAARGTNRGAAAEDTIAAGRTAGFLAHQADTIMQSANVPAEVQQAYSLADRIYAQEHDTFYTPLVQGIVAKFRDYPDTFARTLIKPDNSDVLNAMHKAVESMPRFNAGTVTDPVLRQAALQRNSQYLTGTGFWDARIRPQLQVELIKDHLAVPGPNVSGGLPQFERVVMASPTRFNDPEYVKDQLFSINAPKLLNRLNNMTQATRRGVFGSEAQFQQLYQIAQALRQTQTQLGSGASMLMPIRQSGAATTLLGAAGVATGATYMGTGDPALTAATAITTMTIPLVLAAKMTNPAFVRRLVFGIHNPSTGTAKRVFTEFGQAMTRTAIEMGSIPMHESVTARPLPEVE